MSMLGIIYKSCNREDPLCLRSCSEGENCTGFGGGCPRTDGNRIYARHFSILLSSYKPFVRKKELRKGNGTE